MAAEAATCRWFSMSAHAIAFSRLATTNETAAARCLSMSGARWFSMTAEAAASWRLQMGAIAAVAVADRGRDQHRCRCLAVVGQLASGEVPPEATVRILAAKLEQYVTSDFVTASSEMRPGVAKLTSTLGARLRIRHRRCSPPPKWFFSCSARALCA